MLCSGGAFVSDEMLRDMVEDSYDLIVAAMPGRSAGAPGLGGHYRVSAPDSTQIEANLELVRRMIDAFNRRDTEAMLDHADEELRVRLVPGAWAFTPMSTEDRRASKKFVDEQWSMFDDFRVEAHELNPARKPRGRSLFRVRDSAATACR